MESKYWNLKKIFYYLTYNLVYTFTKQIIEIWYNIINKDNLLLICYYLSKRKYTCHILLLFYVNIIILNIKY